MISIPTSIALLALATPPDAASAFTRLKTLAGSWEAKSERGAPIRIDYRLISNGTVLVQTYQPGSDRETITVFHLDGARLVATHYCAQGNQPRLRLETRTKDAFVFSFFDATNLKGPAASHLVRLEISLDDAQHYTGVETYEEGGKPDVTTLHFERRR